MRTLALAALVVSLSVAACGGTAQAKLSNDEIRAQVGQLADASDGTSLTLDSVPWCVEGISSHEWECRVNELNHLDGTVVETTFWAKCDKTTCRLEADQ